MKPHKYTPEENDYLRKHWPTAVRTDYLTKCFNNKFGTDLSYRRLADHASALKLKKDPRAIKKQRAYYVQVCIEKRGPEFDTRMRARALSGLYFGGKHFSFKDQKRPESAELARKNFTPEVRARAHATRRETIRREQLRLSWGLPQRTKVKLGSMPQWMAYARNHLNRTYGYLFFRYDYTIYYNDDTRRSPSTEAHYNTRGIIFKPLSERETQV